MAKLKCIIVDDEPQARRILESYILKIADLELVASAKNAVEAFEIIQHKSVDLIFLDINMPEITGIGLLQMLKTPPMIIMTTAYSEHAMESYEYDVVDYLLKPIRFERFLKSIDKVKKAGLAKKLVLDLRPVPGYLEFKTDGDVKQIKFEEILFIQSLGNYLKIVTPVKTYVTLKTTKETEEILPKTQFIRIHKSFIVNLEKICAVKGEEVMVDKHTLPIGKTYKKYFFSLISGK